MRKVSSRHTQWLKKELPVLEAEGVISSEVAEQLAAYYDQAARGGANIALVVFSILGSLSIGAGIILLFAHNWEMLSRSTRAFLSFCPLLLGSVLSVVAVMKNGKTGLRESAGLFHAISIGASIALIGQTYHLPSDTPAFLLSWALLAMPLMFLLRSTGACMIYLALICGWCFAAQESYGQAAAFWLLLVPPVIRLYLVFRRNRNAPDTLLCFTGLFLALCICTGGVFERTVPGLWIISYSVLLSGFGLLGVSLYGDERGMNLPKLYGVLGIVVLAYVFTFSDVWRDIGWHHIRRGARYREWGIWFDTGVTLVMLSGWALLAVRAFSRRSLEAITLAIFPLLGVGCFYSTSTFGRDDILNALVYNGFLLFMGVAYIVVGCRSMKLRQVNGGMIIISLLLITRFFDSGFGFLARGIVFILLGGCFLTANLVIAHLRKRREVNA